MRRWASVASQCGVRPVRHSVAFRVAALTASDDLGELLHSATERGALEELREALKDPTMRALIDIPNDDGDTALTVASYRGHAECVALLLAAGAEIDAQARDGGESALMMASMKGNLSCVRTLLAAGAGCEATDADGDTALIIAAARGHGDVVAALLAAGADRTARGFEGKTAEERAETEAIRELLRAGGSRVDAVRILSLPQAPLA